MHQKAQRGIPLKKKQKKLASLGNSAIETDHMSCFWVLFCFFFTD